MYVNAYTNAEIMIKKRPIELNVVLTIVLTINIAIIDEQNIMMKFDVVAAFCHS
jgi:hypothetical protein